MHFIVYYSYIIHWIYQYQCVSIILLAKHTLTPITHNIAVYRYMLSISNVSATPMIGKLEKIMSCNILTRPVMRGHIPCSNTYYGILREPSEKVSTLDNIRLVQTHIV
jgi:hypothetical protein